MGERNMGERNLLSTEPFTPRHAKNSLYYKKKCHFNLNKIRMNGKQTIVAHYLERKKRYCTLPRPYIIRTPTHAHDCILFNKAPSFRPKWTLKRCHKGFVQCGLGMPFMKDLYGFLS